MRGRFRVRARDGKAEDFERWVRLVRAAHDRCAELGEGEIIAALRVYPGAMPDEAISAFARQLAGAWVHAPVRELEKYLRHSEENGGNGKGKAKDQPMTEVYVPLEKREVVL